MGYDYLLIDNPSPGVERMTISSPKSLNALNSAILKEIDRYIGSIDSSTRVLIITGDGPKSFVAGADISEMKNLDDEGALQFARLGAGVFRKIETLQMPVIAAVNGFALGGGCELAMSCDIRIASENALFGQPEVKLGIIPGFSGTYRLSKLAGQGMAKELIFSGRNIKAEEALRIGLVNRVVTPEELMPAVLKLAEMIVANAPLAVGYAKQCINELYDLKSEESIALENDYFSRCFSTSDQKEGMTAFLEKRKASFNNE